MKNNRGSLTIIAIFIVLIFSLYGILLYARSASAYIRQSKSIETIQRAYAQDVPNAIHIADQIGGTPTYAGDYFTIRFNNEGETTIQNVKPGNKTKKPSDPIGETGDFMGWYYVVEGGTEANPTYTDVLFDFDIAPTRDYTLFARYKGEAIMRSQGSVAFWQPTYKENITSITFKKAELSTIPSNISEERKWDVKANNNCSQIIAYLEDDGEGNNTYKLTIVSPHTIYGNPRGNYYFSGFTNLKSIDFSNFDTSKVLNMTNYFFNCSQLKELDLRKFDTSNVTTFHQMFRSCTGLENVNLSSFDTSQAISMSNMFMYDSALKTLDLSSFDTSKVAYMSNMFTGCSGLESINVSSFNTQNVTTMGSMFHQCRKLKQLDLSHFNTKKVTRMEAMFEACNSLENLDISNFDTSNVTTMASMFDGCNALLSINVSSFDTSKVTSFGAMFMACKSLTELDLRSFTAQSATSMTRMFRDCVKLEKISFGNDVHTENVETMLQMFLECNALKEVNLEGFNTSKVNNMAQLFHNCVSLTALNLKTFDTKSATDMNSMFRRDRNLSTIYVGPNWSTENATTDNMFAGCATNTVTHVTE